MADWTTRLTKAEFRGFQFLTENHQTKFGNRLAIHELPGADDPEVEDQGAKAWDGKLNAYFIGPDYDLERNGFLIKLAEHGATWLQHPWLGPQWVRALEWTVSESNDKGGYCAIAIQFVPGGAQRYTVTVDKVDQAIDKTRRLSDAAVGDFALEEMSADGLTAFIAAVHSKLDVLRQAVSLATMPLRWANAVRGLIANIQGEIAALLALPDQYATALRGLADDLGMGSGQDELADTDRPRIVSRIVASAASGGQVAVSGVAATDGAVLRNLAQEETLRSRLLITSAAQIALADYQAADDRDAALATAVVALEGLLTGASDTVFDAAVGARAALIDALLAQDLAPASERDIYGTLPAALLAHRMGVDEATFLARNRVRHPLFVSGHVYG